MEKLGIQEQCELFLMIFLMRPNLDGESAELILTLFYRSAADVSKGLLRIPPDVLTQTLGLDRSAIERLHAFAKIMARRATKKRR